MLNDPMIIWPQLWTVGFEHLPYCHTEFNKNELHHREMIMRIDQNRNEIQKQNEPKRNSVKPPEKNKYHGSQIHVFAACFMKQTFFRLQKQFN